MQTHKFRKAAKLEIIKLAKDVYNEDIGIDDIEVVFEAYISGNTKATMVTLPTGGRYFEITYIPSSGKMYIDSYQKVGTKVVNVDGF